MEFIKTYKIYSVIILLASIAYLKDGENTFALQLLTLSLMVGLLFFLNIKVKYRHVINQFIWFLGIIVFITKIYINGHYLPDLPTFDTGDGLIPDTRGSGLPFLVLFLIDYSVGLIFTFILLGLTNYIRFNDEEGVFKPLNSKQAQEFLIIISVVISLIIIKSVYMFN